MSDGPERMGVDVGGTFTDVVTVEGGELTVSKRPTTDSPDVGVIEAIEQALAGRSSQAIEWIGHGTTVATNAIIEEDWADIALVTTEGCRDVLEIGRQDRPELYDLETTKPDPIVPRDRRFEVAERLDERGRVLRNPSEEAISELGATLDQLDISAIAICLLFAYENLAHERAVTTILEETGLDCPIVRSSESFPEIREYERTLVTSLNAALEPIVSTYLRDLEGGLQARDLEAPLRVMQSNGGTTTAASLADRPLQAALSGPAAGVEGASYVAGLLGEGDLITMDMGGTSCDVSLVRAGTPTVTTDQRVGEYPVRLPMVDIETIGAGGGSIAWLDDGGALRVGPRSSGAHPGPICYGRGGTAPTVTDANVLLGRIDPTVFAPETPVSREALLDRFRTELADPMDVSPLEAAQGVIDVANANMTRAMRVVSVERGHDPRSFSLVAFGGAGGLHAVELAASLEIPSVIIPPKAGVLSALGLLVADRVQTVSRSRVRPLAEVDPAELESTFRELETTTNTRFREEAIDPERIEGEPALALRYLGQSSELEVPVARPVEASTIEQASEAFHDRHERRYGHSAPEEPVELVTVRLRTVATVDPPVLEAATGGRSLEAARIDRRSIQYSGRAYEASCFDRAALPTETPIAGPAVVRSASGTSFLPPGRTAVLQDNGALLIEVSP